MCISLSLSCYYHKLNFIKKWIGLINCTIQVYHSRGDQYFLKIEGLYDLYLNIWGYQLNEKTEMNPFV